MTLSSEERAYRKFERMRNKALIAVRTCFDPVERFGSDDHARVLSAGLTLLTEGAFVRIDVNPVIIRETCHALLRLTSRSCKRKRAKR